MKRLSVLLFLFFTLSCSHAGAESSKYVFTGKDMYESCTHALKGLDKTGEFDNHRFGVCAGYIAGIIDFHTVMTTVRSLPVDVFCLPQNISTAQVIRDVARYLENNPEKHQDLAAYLVTLALREAYPCQEDSRTK
jgi:hypothetical protein